MLTSESLRLPLRQEIVRSAVRDVQNFDAVHHFRPGLAIRREEPPPLYVAPAAECFLPGCPAQKFPEHVHTHRMAKYVPAKCGFRFGTFYFICK